MGAVASKPAFGPDQLRGAKVHDVAVSLEDVAARIAPNPPAEQASEEIAERSGKREDERRSRGPETARDQEAAGAR